MPLYTEDQADVCAGHGALSLYLKNLDQYKSASAFAPACNPSRTPWGKKAFGNYINPSTRSLPPVEWLAYDSSHLLSRSEAPKGALHILVDTGSGDQFLKDGQLCVSQTMASMKEEATNVVTESHRHWRRRQSRTVEARTRSKPGCKTDMTTRTTSSRPLRLNTSSFTPSTSRPRPKLS